MSLFLMDGIEYPVVVTELVRKFSVQDTENAGRTQNGDMYREIIGTFYNYSLTVEGWDREGLDRFWEAVSQPKKSHICTFPYNQETITQRMYVTSGEQKLICQDSRGNRWGQIQVNCIAMTARVKP